MSRKPFIAPSDCAHPACPVTAGKAYANGGCVGGVNHRFALPPDADLVNAPPHYAALTSNPDAVIELSERLTFCLGNVVKYCCRAGRKEGVDIVTDLKKARWYLEREIKRLESSK